MANVTVVCLTFNEEVHLARALRSVQPFARRILVVDSFSTDRTVEIAKVFGARVLQRRFVNYADQFAWALTQGLDTGWVMRLDADEVVEPDLVADIETELPRLPASVTGVEVLYKCVFMGRWMRHGGRYPMYLLRLWRTGVGSIESRWMDEHITLAHAEIRRFSSAFRDEDMKGLTFFTAKHNGYATREAIDVLHARWTGSRGRDDVASDGPGVQGQASRCRYLKLRVYNRLPSLLSPILYFAYRYVVLARFRDGMEGLVYHVLQGLSYRFLVGARVIELSRATQDASSLAERLARLERLTASPTSRPSSPPRTAIPVSLPPRKRVAAPDVLTCRLMAFLSSPRPETRLKGGVVVPTWRAAVTFLPPLPRKRA